MSNDIRDHKVLKLDFVEPVDDPWAPKPVAPLPRFAGDDSRRLARVRVALPAEILVDQNLVIESSTQDISEGGLLLSGYHGPDLDPGTLVSVVIKGIISDRPSVDGKDLFTMEVVRKEGDRLALRFPT